MIAMLLFSSVAAALVFLAGRRDKARDARLTGWVMALLVVFPLSAFLPKIALLPEKAVDSGASSFPWIHVLIFLWFIGFLAATLRLAMAAKGISKWRKQSLLVDRVNGIEIRCLLGLKGPVAAGVIKPVIFVPGGWSGWSDATRRIVLEHEMSHHRRHDPLWRWIAEIACAIYFYNPLVLWMARRLTLQCELACDAMVLKNGVSPSAYARLLCDFAEDKIPCGPMLAMSASSSLEMRVGRLVRPGTGQGSLGILAWIVFVFLTAGAFASIGPRKGFSIPVSHDEVQLRWSANPFPGE
jgi:beta-lactamase regulating signal transducer with metallopeptidase domain